MTKIENDPAGAAQRATRPALPKRFYAAAGVAERDGSFEVRLDEKPVKTPERRPLALPSRALAELVAAEWTAQESVIDPATMPPELEITAKTWTDEIMGVRHRGLVGTAAPLEGVQFHPESIMTRDGKHLLRRFLEMSGG